jgi:hypothetical protein
MSAVAVKPREHDPRVSPLLQQHAQALKAGDFMRAYAALGQIVELEGTSENPFPLVNASGIFAPLEPCKYVIRAIDLCPGAPGLWAGYGYSKKTIAAQSAALDIAAGTGNVWGCFASTQGRVLHLDYEQGERLSRERYQRLGFARMIGPDDLGDRLSLVSMPRRYLEHPAAEVELSRLVEGYTLVIADSLTAACPTIEQNASEARRPLDMLTRVSEKTGAAFVVIHHARKPNASQQGGLKMAIRGSGAIFDACSSVLVFEGEKDQPTRVSHEKARSSGIETDDFEIAIADIPDGANPMAGVLVTAAAALSKEDAVEEAAKARRLAKLDRTIGELTELFEREAGQPGADAIAAKLGRHAPDVRAALKVMVDRGWVEPTGKTSDRRHKWLGRE